MSTPHDGIGDICAIKATIHNQPVLIVSAYITPGTSIDDIEDFFELNLMAYSEKARVFKVVRKNNYHLIPIILAGDFNINLKSKEGVQFIEFMKDTFDLQINSDPALSTTRNGTCIDAMFTRHVGMETQNYISYFSYHRPLISVVSNTINEN